MIKIVLDTNVLVSGLLKPFSGSGEIVRMTSSGIIQICYDARILSEYRSVLARPKFEFDQSYVSYLLEQLEVDGEVVATEPLRERLPDKDDEPFLEVALAGKVHSLITGNIKHYPSKLRWGVLVVTPLEFLELYRKKKA